jgi:carbonic anhydrase
LVFDQGLGDIFSVRIAGNFVNEDILGSMEFASKLAGTKLIVVLGHTSCGAIKGACDNAKMGNLTKLIEKITPAVKAVTDPKDASLRNSNNSKFVDNVSHMNVKLTIERIHAESPILSEMEKNGEILIVGAMYDINTGEVSFFE